MRGINASNNNFTRLDGLLTIPNKNKVEKLNLFGNKISEVDFALIFREFPSLKYLNLDRNPLRAKNLSNLTGEQLNKLAEGLKSKQIRIGANQGTILADLLEYTQHLIKSGDNSQRQQAQQLQAVIQNNSVKNETPNNNSKTPLLIGGGILALAIGYLVGRRKKLSND